MTFSYIPGAYGHAAEGGGAIYIKYGKYPDTITVREYSSNHAWIITPDRELFITSNAHHNDGNRPLDCNFDKVLYMGMSYNSARDFNVKNVMVNSHADSKSKHKNLNHRRDGKKRGVDIISDSGGFQILTGRADIIDPRE